MFDWLKPLFYLPLVVVVILMFMPIADWAKAVIADSIVAAYLVPVCIVLLRGPMIDNEKEAITAIVPAVVSAVRKEMRTRTAPSKGGDLSIPENSESESAQK